MKNESWIEDLLEENRDVETPESWIYWSLLTCISAAAANNYFVASFSGKVLYYTNMYVMLLGESGLGKGYPVNLAKRLVTEAKVTRVIAGRSSIQAIVKELATTRTLEGQKPLTDSRGFIVNGELSTAVIADPDALTILTDLYDRNYNKEWTNMLKGDGHEKLKEPCITALFGSSPAHFYDSIPQANIEGGYIGRNLIVYEEKRSKDLDLLDDGKIETDRFDEYICPKFVPHLQKIASMRGQIKPTDDARNLFNTWRKKWRNIQQPDKTGFLNRVPDHVLKVAMCLSLSRYDFNGEIGEINIDQAIQKVTALQYSNKKASEASGLDPLLKQKKIVLDHLIAAKNNTLHRKELLRKGYGQFDAPTLDKIIEDLLELGWITREKLVAGKATDWILHLAGEPLIEYQKFVAGNNGNLR